MKTIYMTISEFKETYRLPEDKTFGRVVTQARIGGWRGLKLKTRWSSNGRYEYPVASLKKIARALNMVIVDPMKRVELQSKQMMTIREFRAICPGLPKRFSTKVSDCCRRRGIAAEGGLHSRSYPYNVLKRIARCYGKDAPVLPGTIVDAEVVEDAVGRQTELPFSEQAGGEPREFREKLFARLDEANRLLSKILEALKGAEQ